MTIPLPRKALFLDRDGIINVDKGYVHDPSAFEWMPGIFDLTRTARDLGALLIVVTNQSGIARGYYSEETYQTITRWMSARFEAEGVPLTQVYHCPYLKGPDGRDHPLRKPNPGMFLAARDAHDIDMAASAMLGDKWTDMQAARTARVTHRALVGIPQDGEPSGDEAEDVTRLEDLAAAENWLRQIL